MQAGLILGHGYVPEKRPQDKTQNSKLTNSIFGVTGL
jgi:hypothetical protein